MSIFNGERELTQSSDTGHPLIRRLAEQDIDQVYAIEQLAYPFPWTRSLFVDCLNAGYACYGLQIGRDLTGYTIFNWAANEAHLLNLCIHPEWQHRGYGSLLLEYAINQIVKLDNQSMFLEVRESNLRAADLYRNRGFKVIGYRPSYYKAGDGRENAIVMLLDLGKSEPV